MSHARGFAWGFAIAGVVLVVVVAAVGVVALWPCAARSVSQCRLTVGDARYGSREQAENATTVAAVGKRLGLPDHAVTVALAAGLAESGLRNLAYGDRDSLGVFQQRPSQGWGIPAEVMTPHLAAAAFFEHLARVDGWQSLPVGVAAQRVQRSARPNAYAGWEPEARTLAIATTGEVPAALSCQSARPATPTTVPLAQAMTEELGAGLGSPVSAGRGWTIATWLVAHADRFQLVSVSFAGQQWTASTGQWQPHAPVLMRVDVRQRSQP